MRRKISVIITVSVILLILLASLVLFLFRGYIFIRLAERSFLKAGKPVKLGTYTVLIDNITGNKLFGIKITGKNRKLEAKSGEYTYMPKENAVRFNLIDGTAEDYDPKNPGAFRRLTFEQMFMKIRLKSRGPE